MFIMKQTDDNNINPSNAFCVITLLIILMIALMGLMSCSTHRVVEQVKEMHTDTVYVTSLQYDSIYIYNDKTLDRTKDTAHLLKRSRDLCGDIQTVEIGITEQMMEQIPGVPFSNTITVTGRLFSASVASS